MFSQANNNQINESFSQDCKLSANVRKSDIFNAAEAIKQFLFALAKHR